MGSVDPGRETLRATQWRSDAAALFGTHVAETILASGRTAAQTGRTHGRKRPDPDICHLNLASRGPSTMEITTIGLDIAKRVFQAHGVDAGGKAVLRRKLALTQP